MQKPIEALQYRTPLYHPREATRYIVIHHAAATYPRGEALQRIYDYHKSQWPAYAGIGYHVVIQEDKDGSLTPYLVNPPEQFAAHTLNHNHHAFGICAATNLAKGIPNDWYKALVDQAAYWANVYQSAQIVGHQALRDTSCPGVWWSKQKNMFLEDVRQTLGTDPFIVWDKAGFPISFEQRNWAIPKTWEANQSLGAPTSYETYLNNWQSFQGFENGTLYYNAKTAKVKRIA